MNTRAMRYLTHKAIKISIVLAFTLILGSMMLSYSPHDLTLFYQTTDPQPIKNYLGAFGAHSIAVLLYLFGSSICLFFIVALWLCYVILANQALSSQKDRLVAIALFIPVCCAVAYHYGFELFSAVSPGGAVGALTHMFISRVLFNFDIGAFLYVACCGLLVMILRFTFVQKLYPIYAFLVNLSATKYVKIVCISLRNHYVYVQDYIVACFTIVPDTSIEDALYEIYQDPIWNTLGIPAQVTDDDEIAAIEMKFEQKAQNKVEFNTSAVMITQEGQQKTYAIPNKKILHVPSDTAADLEQQKESSINARILQEKLERFGIQGKVVSIINGPVVTLFEYQPTIDTKVSTILARENDLALALQAISLRIIAPIPGKSVVGFEVAHNKRKTVYFSSMLMSKQWTSNKAVLPLIIGQDTLGENIIIDLAKMPHLLVAGSTGSGKSAGLNAMLMSLLYSKTPHQLRLVLIDPKRLEFASYADIAHLLFPIITEPTKAVLALKWLVRTMEERYETMAKLAVRNIEDYYKMYGYESEHFMPYIVVVMDELADLMMTASKEAEQLIARLAQMARAAGIHVIIATQRPSVDVITGLIKVNFPSRIAFKVTSKIDSRTIIDGAGAEKLLGRGDMLFMDSAGMLKRVHGAYVSDEEIHAVVGHIKTQQEVVYELLQVPQAAQDTQENDDELLDDVISFIEKREDISISLVQRAFRIGYNRSARIVEQLELQGHILPSDGSKMRKVAKK